MVRSRKSHQKKVSHKFSPINYVLPSRIVTAKKLDVVTNRLQRSDYFTSRLELEGIEMSSEKYIERLHKNKTALIKKMKQFQKISKPKKNDFQTRTIAFSNKKRLPQKNAQLGGIERYDYSGYSMEEILRSFYYSIDSIDPLCFIQGYEEPAGYGSASISGNSITHNSSTWFSWDDDDYLNQGALLFNCGLDDDDSFWRVDHPDFYSGGFETGWVLPEAKCDGEVLCWIDAKHQGDFFNSADDAGQYWTFAVLVNSDDEGNMPNNVDIDRAGLLMIHEDDTDSYISDTYTLFKKFPIKKGKVPEVNLSHIFTLLAQDGAVGCTLGVFWTNRVPPSLIWNPPKLYFQMIPSR